jgi:hypothetical protein
VKDAIIIMHEISAVSGTTLTCNELLDQQLADSVRI